MNPQDRRRGQDPNFVGPFRRHDDPPALPPVPNQNAMNDSRYQQALNAMANAAGGQGGAPPGSTVHTSLGYTTVRIPEGAPFPSMGVEGRAKQLANISAVAVIAGIAVMLLSVVVGVMYKALGDSDTRTDTLIKMMQESVESQHRREDSIREQERLRFESMVARMDAQTAAINSLSERVSSVLSEVRTARSQVEAAATQIKDAKKGADKEPEDDGEGNGAGPVGPETAPMPRRC